MVDFTASSDRGEEKLVSGKLKYQWVQWVLEQTGIDTDGCFPETGDISDQTILQKALLKKILKQNKIIIKDYHDESLEIYVDEERIAYWSKPYYKLIIDTSKLNKKDQQYIEIEMECWSVFDE